VVWFARGCKRCAALGMHDLPVDGEVHLLFSCPATAVVRRERRFAHLPFTSLQDLMCCRDVYGVALFVHECMKTADAAAVDDDDITPGTAWKAGKPRHQPRQVCRNEQGKAMQKAYRSYLPNIARPYTCQSCASGTQRLPSKALKRHPANAF
jgi:hypothetical protein